MSEENIYSALAKFRNKLVQPAKTEKNHYFGQDYVGLEGVMNAIDQAIEGLGLSYIQEVKNLESGAVAVQTVIFYQNGEHLESGWLALKPDKQTAQGYGSAITYSKRYQLSAMFGVSSDPDDDGNAASNTTNEKSATKQQTRKKQQTAKPAQKKNNNQTKEDSTNKNLGDLYKTFVKQAAENLNTTFEAVHTQIKKQAAEENDYIKGNDKEKSMILVRKAEAVRNESQR